MADKGFLVIGVALLTWGVFFIYLLRLGALTRRLENEVRAAEAARLDASRDESEPLTNSFKTPVA